MRDLFLIATGQDTAGWNWRIKEAMERFAPDWDARCMAATPTYLEYPIDLPWDKAECLRRYAAADVIHLQNQAAGWTLYDNGAGKPTILQHHGTIYREMHERIGYSARKIGMVEICSTLDLTLYEPNVEWIPIPYRRRDLLEIRHWNYDPDGRIRIAHAPTNRQVKGTDHFLAVMERLEARYPNVQTVMIEQKSWRTCLARKATADIFYDQLELGYGCNAIEAWGMGIPVVAGVTDPKVRQVMFDRWGALPFMEASTDTLEQVLSWMIESMAMRMEFAQIGSAHFDRWHDERVVTPMLTSVYAAARPTRPGPTAAQRHAEARMKRRAIAARV